jgi:hypothetical protein
MVFEQDTRYTVPVGREFSHTIFIPRNHKGKVVAKYVGPRTKGTLIKRNVWVPKVLVTNALGPNSTWVPKTQA